MPTYAGVKLSIFSQVEQMVHPELPHLHPEFPHPESSQFTYRTPDVRGASKKANFTPPSVSSDSKADRLLGRQSVVAVYIPSVPGTRFWIRYSLDEVAAATSQWFYFKLYMNGRQITSWGLDARTQPSGQIMKGLFEPSPYWNYEIDGVQYKNMGLEQRSFFFAYDDGKRSAASDGGLIEIHVYRARGRKRKMPDPVDFKNQEEWGIMMPSEALFEHPEDARFYDWHLKDPKDKPFTIFKFHYRSWESLASLQLIPPNFPRNLLPPSASLLSIIGLPRDVQVSESAFEPRRESTEMASEVSEASITPWLTSVFDDPPESAKNYEKREAFVVPPEVLDTYALRFPAPSSKFANAVIDKQSSPKTSPTTNLNRPLPERPLPEIPTRKSSLRQGRHYRKASVHSRKSSAASACAASIAPSLLAYVDRETTSPEPEIGVAETVDVSHSSPIVATTDGGEEQYSTDDETEASFVCETASKRRSIRSLPHLTIRKYEISPRNSPSMSSMPSMPSMPTTPSVFKKDEKENRPTSMIEKMTSLSVTEQEWMSRTPPPVKNRPTSSIYSELWSPEPGMNKRNTREFSPSRKRSLSVSETGMVIPEDPSDSPTMEEFDDEDKIRSGNWI